MSHEPHTHRAAEDGVARDHADPWAADASTARPSGTAHDRGRLAAMIADVEPMVRGICRRQLGHDAGDDAAQTVLLRVWQNLTDGREFDDLRTYAAVSSKYAGRPKPSREAIPVGESADMWADHTEYGPAEQYIRDEEVAEARGRVDELLAGLSPREAEIIRARALEDRSTAEVADELGIKPTSVRSAQVRAMARMRETCGTRSFNPLASDLSPTERARLKWQREKARRTTEAPTADHRASEPGDRALPATRSAEEAAEILARGGRPLDEARALVGEYLDAVSDRVGVSVYASGLEDADIACIAADARSTADVVSPQRDGSRDAEAERVEELARWHEEATTADEAVDEEGAVRS